VLTILQVELFSGEFLFFAEEQQEIYFLLLADFLSNKIKKTIKIKKSAEWNPVEE